MNIQKYLHNLPAIRKAIAAFLVGLGGFLSVTLPLATDGNLSNEDIVAMIGALAAWMAGTGFVFGIRNEKRTK